MTLKKIDRIMIKRMMILIVPVIKSTKRSFTQNKKYKKHFVVVPARIRKLSTPVPFQCHNKLTSKSRQTVHKKYE